MKKINHFPILLLISLSIFSLTSCNWVAKKIQEIIVENNGKDTLKGVPYTPSKKLVIPSTEKKIALTKRINWEVKLPAGYSEMTVSELKAIEQKGEEAINNSGEVSAQKSNTVYAAKKADGKNSVLVTTTPYNALRDGLFTSLVADSKLGIEQTYRSVGMPISSSQSTLKIDDLNWNRIHVTIYADPSRQKIVMLQNIYMALVENDVITITSSTTNIADNLLLVSAINNSKFR